MLRLCLCVLAILLFASQAFAQVSVYVDMQQIWPKDFNGEVQVRVGKNKNAIFYATAGYNGQPTLHAEEEITGETWTYTISACADVNYNPKSGNGNSVSITASSTKPGTYTITATFKLTFTIKTPQKDGQDNYVYDSDGKQQFTTRSDGPYSGSGSATLTVSAGKFNITLIPSDDCKETNDKKRDVKRFGLGESGAIEITPCDPNDTLTVIEVSAVPTDICMADESYFTIKRKPGSATITVVAKIEGCQDTSTETYGLTAILPYGLYFHEDSKEYLENAADPNAVGAAFKAYILLLPMDVSFSGLPLREDDCMSIVTGNCDSGSHNPNKNFMRPGPGDVEFGCIWALDTVRSYLVTRKHNETYLGTGTWNIKLLYENDNGDSKETGIVTKQMAEYLPKGTGRMTKLNISLTRKPKNLPIYMMNPTTYDKGFEINW